ncbi:hypothetical protein BGZ46_000211 [Entomortierella lignicola]|nr:hypothetical protein BGZ46_000211 [Entomortierella lignicola]
MSGPALSWRSLQRHSKGYIYKEGFWAMVAATILSFISTALMSIDLHRTPTLQLQDSGLTQKQRILLASVMLLCLYLTLGALIIYYIEHLNYLDSLYFCMATITTIGYGDIAPDTPGSRVFVVFYAVGGMVLLGLFVKSIHYVIIEEQQGRFMVLAKAREKKRNERRLNNKQRRMQEIQMREIKSGEGHRPHILQHIHGHLELPSIFRHASHASGDDRSKRAGAEERGGQSSVPALPQNLYEDESTEISEGGVQRAIHENHGSGITANPTKSHSRPTNFIKSWWYRFPCNRGTQEKPEETHHKLTRREQKAKETEEAYRETMREYYLRLQISSALFVLFWIVGALIFRGTESWGFGSAMYFMVITFTTLGYGDYSPKTKAGKIMFLVYVLLGVVMFTWLASLISDILSNKMKSHAVKVELDKRARLISGAGLDLDLEEGKPQDKSDDDDPESLAQLVEAIDAIIEPIPTEEVSGDCIYRLIKDIKEFDLILQKVLGVDHPRHLPDPSSDSLASSSHTHVQNKNGTVTISAAQWQHIVDYSGRLITLTEVLELVLQKLTDWEISEDQRRLERQQVYLRRKRFMKNRRKQLHEYEATHGLSNSEVENEVDELDDLYDDEIMNEIMEELMVRRRSSLATDFLGSSRMLRALGNRRSSFPTTRSDYNEDDRNNNDPSSLLRKAMRANPNVLHPLSLLMHLQSFKRRAGQKKKTERSIDRTILEQDMEDIERRMNRIGSDGHSSQYATTQGRLGEVSTSNALPIGHHPQHSTSM